MRDELSRGWVPPAEAARDPLQAAQQAAQPERPKRFYATATAEARDGGFALLLDGRPARTPGRRSLAVPSQALAEAVAGEWQTQGAEIDPRTMPLTRLVNSALDGVAEQRTAVVHDLVRYAGSDLICYRADGPDRLVAAQAAAWDPILTWAREALGARFVLAEGVMHVPQPEPALAALRARIEGLPSAFALAGLHVMTTLTGSVLIALAHAVGPLGAEEAWDAAHVDETYQESVWGEDQEALERRSARRTDFLAASTLFRLSGAA